MADIPWDELMDAAGDSDFAPIPASDYDVKITKAEATKSSTDKPMWKITCEVQSGPHEGRLVFTNQTLSTDNPNALNIFFRQMAAAGLTADFFRTKPNPTQIADALVGRHFRAKVAIREWQGVPRNEIKAWNPLSAAAAGAPGGPPPAGAPAAGGPPPPPAARPATAPPPPPPAAAAPPAPAAAAPPASEPAAAAPPAAAAATPPPPPATPDPTRDGPAVGQPQADAQPQGSAGDWVVQGRETVASEPPPF